MSQQIFDFQPALVPLEPGPVVSAGRQRTLRQHALVAAGIHPLARTRTVPEVGTCGDCQFRVLFQHHDRSYPKCTRFQARITHSAASDCRAWWPACTDWQASPKESS